MPTTFPVPYKVSKQYIDFYNQIKEFLSDEYVIPEEKLQGSWLEIPILGEDDDENYKKIINEILLPNKYLSVWGKRIAFFHGYFGKEFGDNYSYTFFKNMNQKLNLAMRYIYSNRAPQNMTGKERDGINQLLCDYLEKMLENSGVLGNAQGVVIGRILNRMKRSLKSQIKIELDENDELVVSMNHVEYNNLSDEFIMKTREEITQLKTQLDEQGKRNKKTLDEIYELLKKRGIVVENSNTADTPEERVESTSSLRI